MPNQKNVWPVCPECGLSAEVMNDFVTQRFDVPRRVQFKMLLGNCYLCSDVYHREREFLVFAAQELYPTKYDVPVVSEERLTWDDFLSFYSTEETSYTSYRECFRAGSPSDDNHPFLSDFPVAALALVTEPRLRNGLLQLSSPDRTVMLLYLMGARSYSRLSELVDIETEKMKLTVFRGRRMLQSIVCRIDD